MNTKTSLTAAAISVAAVLAAPGLAAAAIPSLYSNPSKVKGYSLTVSGSGTNQAKYASVFLSRTRSGAYQSYSVSKSKSITYTAKTNLSSAKLSASFGKYGRISMKFRATGPKKKSLPKGCKGKPSASRAGIISGTLKVRLDGKFFRTIRKSRLSATLTNPGTFTCKGGPVVFPKTKYTLSDSLFKTGGYSSFTFGKDAKNRVSESVSNSKNDFKTGLSYSRSIYSGTLKSKFFTATSSLASASVTGGAPFFGGKGSYKRTGSSGTLGTLTGSLVAKFDSGGFLKLPKGGTATLTKG